RLIPAHAGSTLSDLRLYLLRHVVLISRRGETASHPKRRRRDAALQRSRGVGPLGTSPPPDRGRLIRAIPSKSTGSQSCPCTSKSKRCSLRATCTMIARPDPTSSITRPHNRSRTRALTCPTKTPGETSSSHLVRCPRRPTGHAVSTTTVTSPPRCHR